MSRLCATTKTASRLLHRRRSLSPLITSSLPFSTSRDLHSTRTFSYCPTLPVILKNSFPLIPPHRFSLLHLLSTSTPTQTRQGRSQIDESEGEESEGEPWEEEEEVEAKMGDGGDGGGVVLGDVGWGERALSAAREILLEFDDDIVMFAFKVYAKGYIYLRLDKLTHKYGCPSMEEMEKFTDLYKQRLDEMGQRGELPDNLAVEVSSPGGERLLKVPEDLDRFKDMPMWVCFSEGAQQSEKVLMLESVNTETQECVWKLADVKENRDALGKGRPLSKKQKNWRETLSFQSIGRVKLYLQIPKKSNSTQQL